MKYLRVKELIEILQSCDPELPVIITDDGKGHQYGITDKGIKVIKNAYFGNNDGAAKAFEKGKSEEEQIKMKYLNLGNF